MMAHGRLTMVCPDRTEQLYAAADREFEDPERAREAARGGYGAVAFFGLAATRNSLIAIGHNGLYRLASDGTATHVPLPASPGSMACWSASRCRTSSSW